MGKPNACFRIIACGSAEDEDNLDVPENKSGNDKRGWSFRKKPARHRVLSNTVTSETPASGNKEIPESAVTGSKLPENSAVPEKIFAAHAVEEKTQNPLPVSSKESEPEDTTKTEKDEGFKVDEKADDSTGNDKEAEFVKADGKADEGLKVDEKGNDNTGNVRDLEVIKVDDKGNEGLKVDEKADDSTRSDEKADDYTGNDKEVKYVKGDEKAEDSSRSNKEVEFKADEKCDAENAARDEKEEDTKVNIEHETDGSVGEEAITHKADDILDKSIVVFVQACVRRFLAQRELMKRKKVVRLQAAVRGHLVRRHAVGALRCVQAIVKMQTLVRARRARISIEASLDEKTSASLGKETLEAKPKAVSASVEKLLNNRFAQQLMETAPKAKPIRIKCDTSKPNSAWNWLERWVSISTPKKTLEAKTLMEPFEREENKNVESATENSSNAPFGIADSYLVKESTAPMESEENPITYEAEKIHFQADQTADLSVACESDVVKLSTKVVDSHLNQPIPLLENSQSDSHSLSEQSGLETEQPKRALKRLAPEDVETGGKKFISGSRKASNPSFIAAQSKFEVLSLTANPGKSMVSSNLDTKVESKSDRLPSAADGATSQLGGSECGTELSVSSTLDSPDRSETGAAKYEHEIETRELATHENENIQKSEFDIKESGLDIKESELDIKESRIYLEKLEPDVKGASDKTEAAMSCSAEDREGKPDDCAKDELSSSVECTPEKTRADVKTESQTETVDKAHRFLSPEASARSLITVPESQVTPSSQVSVKSKKVRTEKTTLNRKQKSLSAGKKSPSNLKHNTGGAEQLPKHQKSGKRRNSFGSPKPEQVDQEDPRDSSGSNSLPRFMQATQSARAKINANTSPRSSPDVHEKDHVKKRHSLPGANGRQGSPRIQRSMSQAQQERKWQK